ncbi:MAG: Bax inhibitor-1/YccA family protein, partial [Syntrophales bacterium]|nr:Bax inhibitor-1/YccA family protein [Syntrophales bacterium]
MTNGQISYQRDRVAVVQGAFIRRVYNWMALGLAATALIALYTAGNPALLKFIFGNTLVFFGLIIAELGLVIWLSAGINRMQFSTASAMFFVYSALNGLTLSVIFLTYTRASIASTFFVTAGTFGVMSLYGYTTKKDLSSWGSFFFMGLIGIIIASVVNIFLKSPMVYWVVTYAGILVFVGLTAYDTNKLKQMAMQGFADEETEGK